MRCLDDETIDALVAGRLDGPALARADAHLDACAQCRELVLQLTALERRETSASSGAGETAEPEAASSGPGAALDPEAPPGTRFGRFVALEPVGAGAMGVVYAAYDPKLDRRVALKLMRTDTDQDPARARARLVREARSMAQLSHPNVIAVYDVGTVDASVFVAMELVDGQDLRQWCKAQRRSWREIREVYVQAATGLGAAHAVGLIHRDFKPDNVLVGPHGRAWVGDFGLARSAPSPVTEDDKVGSPGSQTITRSGAMAGTPAYMAPEVLFGQPADARSDQFSLCTACYEAVAGTHPRPASTLAQLAVRIESGQIEPPVDRQVPGWLLAVLIRGMSRRPEDRFADMDALRAALRRDQRIRARAGLAVGAAVLIGTTSGAFWLGQETYAAPAPCGQAPTILGQVWDEPTRDAIASGFVEASPGYGETTAATVHRAIDAWGERWVEAHQSTCEATHVRGEQSEALLDLRMACLRDQLQQIDALSERLAEPTPEVVERAVGAMAALPVTERCADVDALVAVLAPADEAMAAAVEAQRPSLAQLRALVTTAQFSRAEAQVQPQVRAAARIGHDPLIAEAQLLSAHVARGLGRLEHAREAGYDSLWAAQRSRDDTAVARAWLALQGIAGQRGRWDEAAHLGNHAEAAVSRLGMPPGLEATLRNGLGIVAEQRGEYEQARLELQRALELRVELHGAEHPEVARVHTNLGNLARRERRLEDAIAQHRRAMAIDAVALGQGHPALGRHHHNLARLLLLTGDPQQAKEHYEQALAIRVAAHGPSHPDVARTHNSLGLLYARLGQVPKAREEYGIALRMFEALDHVEQGLVRHNLELLDAEEPSAESPGATDFELVPDVADGRRRRSGKRISRSEPASERVIDIDAEPVDAAPVDAAPPEPKLEPKTETKPEPPSGAYSPGRAWDAP